MVIDRVKRIGEPLFGEEQSDFRKGRGCMNQIFALRQVTDEVLEKDKKVYVASIYLVKT